MKKFLLILAVAVLSQTLGCGEETSAEQCEPDACPESDAGADAGVDATAPLVPMEEPPGESWASFRGNPARTGYSPTAVTGRSVEEAWRIEDINTTDYSAAKGSPSVSGDQLFIGTDDARFLAIDRFTGEMQWEKEIPDTSHGIHGSPSIGPEYAYIGAYNGILYAFDRATGEEAWSYQIGFQVGASPVLVPAHGRIYNTHEHSNKGGGWVISVDARTGEEVWTYRIRAHPHSSVAVDQKNNLLFVGDNLAKMHGFDAFTGEKIWEVDLPQPGDSQSDIKTTPTVIESKDLVVVGAWSDKVHAFDVFTGDIVWETDVGANIMGSTAYAPGRDVVYVGSLSPSSSVHALNAETGEELWRFPSGSVMSSPAINADESLVVVGSYDGNLYAIDAETGEEVWKHDIGGAVTSSPALVEEWVYVAAARGDLVALETQ